MKTYKLLLIFVAMAAGVSMSAQDFRADTDNSVLQWTGTKVIGKHYGKISLKEGEFTISDNKIISGSFVIDMSSITNEDLSGGMKDKLLDHLKSDDFFSTSRHSLSTLEITGSEPFSNNEAVVSGKLTIKDITHPITFTVKRDGNTFTSGVTVDRTLYNIKYGSGKFFQNLGDNMISDNFELEVTVKAIQ
ncbi:MAG: YceI family protein [Bacteroidales bacterium]